MNFEKILFGIGALIGLLLFRQTKPIILKIILIGLALSVGLSFFTEYININIPFFSFGLLTLGFTIWCGIQGKWTSMIIGLFAFLSFTWSFMNFQHWGLLQFLMIIPLGLFIWTLYKRKEFKDEISVLTAIAAFELSEFILCISRLID